MPKSRKDMRTDKEPVWAVLVTLAVALMIIGVIIWVSITFMFKAPPPTVCIQKGYADGSTGWTKSDIVETITVDTAEKCLEECSKMDLDRMSFQGFAKKMNCACYSDSRDAWPPNRVLYSNTDSSFGISVKNKRFTAPSSVPCTVECDQCVESDSTCIGTLR